VAIWPAAGFLAAGAGLERAFADLLENGATTGVAELYPFDAFSRLVGFEDVWDFERRHAERSASLAAK
jgi:hypothetical protein